METTNTDLRYNMAHYLEKVCFSNEPLFITKHKKTVAVLISHDEYIRLITDRIKNANR